MLDEKNGPWKKLNTPINMVDFVYSFVNDVLYCTCTIQYCVSPQTVRLPRFLLHRIIQVPKVH